MKNANCSFDSSLRVYKFQSHLFCLSAKEINTDSCTAVTEHADTDRRAGIFCFVRNKFIRLLELINIGYIHLKCIINIFNIIGPILTGVLTIDNLNVPASVIISFSAPVLYWFWSYLCLDSHYVAITFPFHYIPSLHFFMITVPKQRYKRRPIQARINCSVSTLCVLPIGRRSVCPVSHNPMCIPYHRQVILS